MPVGAESGADLDLLFAGRDGVARDMAAVDWAATALGPPASWSPELRGVIQVMLASRFAMWMAWGPALTMFYNDAYRRDTLRDRHPWALGRPANEVWAEVWDVVTPQVRAVLDEGRSTWDEDLELYVARRGRAAQTYHTFSYSPVADGHGTVRGLLCVVAETTERVLAQRRMALLRDLAAATTDARSTTDTVRAAHRALADDPRDLPMVLLYLTDRETGDRAGLAAAVGVAAGGPVAPSQIGLSAGTCEETAGWPLARARTGPVEMRVPPALADGVPDACDRVALVPLVAAGESDGPLGVLVLGLSRHLVSDEPYRHFVDLVAAQLTSAVLDARAAESERERAEGLAALDAARRRFFADASHELRTPLTLIRGPLRGLLAESEVEPARWREEIEVVERNTRRLARLVDDLLEVSRLDAGGEGRRRPVPVDLGRLTAELAGTIGPTMAREGLDHRVDVPPAGEAVAVLDPRDWERIVGNLLSNALAHTPAGGVTVRVARRGEDIELGVTDTGIGIPADEIPRLFERFHRVEGAWARTAEGTGIGLAMVAELTAALGGRVGVASEPGAGSTFTVTVPAAPAGTVASGAHRAEDLTRVLTGAGTAGTAADGVAAGPGSGDGSGNDEGRILVADDNDDMRAYLRRLLAPLGAVATVGDGDAALAAALAAPPDMVVSDVMMPGRDGLALLAALRADPRTARIPVLLLSARAGQEAAIEGFSAEADDYMVKPFDPAELRARVTAHLRLGRQRREAEARFVALADLAPAMIWTADADGARTFLNAGWTRFTGRAPADEYGDGWRSGLHPDDRAGYETVVARARATGRGWETEFRLCAADGTHRRVVEQASWLSGADGSVGAGGGWVGSCVDVESRLRRADRDRLLAEIGERVAATDRLDERLDALRAVLETTHLADRVVLLAPGGTAPDRAPGTIVLRREIAAHRRPAGSLLLERAAAAGPWEPEDAALLDEILARVGPALDNAVLRAEERTAAARLALVARATASFSAAATPDAVAHAALAHISQLMGPTVHAAVFEFDPAARELRLLVRRPAGPDPRSSGDVIGLDTDTLLTRAVRGERSLWVHEPEPGAPDDQDPALLALLRARGLRRVVAFPLIAAGRVVGGLAAGTEDLGSLDEGERTTLLALAEPCAIALDRARLYRAEHRIAETLQRSLLPQGLPEVERLPIAVRYRPGAVGTSAGGDWYDAVEVEPGRVAVVVGDVVGHGTAAAAVMGQLRAALTGYLLAGHGPAQALDLLDRLVARVPGARASTAICVVVDVDGGRLCWARAGHLPALVLDADGAHLLSATEGHGPLLGLGPLHTGARTEGEIHVTPGASLVLYTDGLVERHGESLDEDLDRLLAVSAGLAGHFPEALAGALVERLAPAEAVDDVAVVVTRLLPAPMAQRLAAEPASLSLLRRGVRDWAAAAGVPPGTVEDLQLALGEAATNAIEHAYGASPPAGAEFGVRLAIRDCGGVLVEVHDEGSWREVPADPGHRGRGLVLINELARDVEVERGPAGTRVTFTVVPSTDAAERGVVAPPTPRAPRVEVDEVADGLVVTVGGDLDLVGAALLARRIADVRAARAARAASWTLDARDVGHLASAGIAVLLDARERGALLRLPTAGPALRALQVTGLIGPSAGGGRG